MDLNYLKKIVRILDESTLSFLEIEEEGIKIKLERKLSAAEQPMMTIPMQAPVPYFKPEVSDKPISEIKVETSITNSDDYYEIKSPIVGTFYRAPSPDSAPYTEVGTRINIGSPLCIIEAMKLMNEIESDVAGTIEKILVENGQPVEFNQPLFLVRKD